MDALAYVDWLSKGTLVQQAADFDQTSKFPEELVQELSKRGIFRIGIAKTYWGDGDEMQVFLEMIQKVSESFLALASILFTQSSFAIWPLLRFGTKEQREEYLVDFFNGERWGSFALNEATGSFLDDLHTIATEKEDHWVLTGDKVSISNAPIADLLFVVARTHCLDESEKYGVFLVDAKSPGVTISEPVEKVGLKALTVADIQLKDVQVPKEAILGGSLAAQQQIISIINRIRICISAQSIGIAKGALKAGLQYVTKERKFGLRLINLLETQRILAEVDTAISAAEVFLTQGLTEGMTDLDATKSRQIAKIKLFCTNTSIQTTESLVAMTGGYGYTRSNQMERLSRDAKITGLYGGSADAQKRIIAAKWLHEREENK